MAHDVFICHSSKDKIAADTACAVLERAGIRCWVAPRDVPAGESWAAAIIRAINSSKVMLLLFSGHTNESPQIEREIERAVHRHIPVVTFRLEDVLPIEALEYFISSAHWLDAFTPPINRHYEALATRITALLADSSGSAEAPPQPGGHLGAAPIPPVARLGRSAKAFILPATAVAVAVLALVTVFYVVRLAATPTSTRGAPVSQAPAVQPAVETPAAPATQDSVPAAETPSALSYPIHLNPNGDNWVALRSEPSTTSGVRLAKLGPDASFVVLGAPGAWSHVRTTDGQEGWVDSHFVGCCRSPSSATARPSVCTVADPTPTPLNVRASPDGAIVSTLTNGVSVTVADHVVHDGKAWSQITAGDSAAPLGWVFTDYLICPTS